MDRTRRWLGVALVLGGLWAGCSRPAERDPEPKASDREARSELLRDLVASREKAPDPEKLKGPPGSQQPSSITPEPPGQGGSGRPEPTGSLQGRVEWVGDDELLIRDAGGVERDLEVRPDTRLVMKGEEVGLREVQQGDQVRVAYDEGTGGWVARQVEVLLPASKDPLEALPRGQGAPAPPPR